MMMPLADIMKQKVETSPQCVLQVRYKKATSFSGASMGAYQSTLGAETLADLETGLSFEEGLNAFRSRPSAKPLPNHGGANICWLNATLQMLFNWPSFVQALGTSQEPYAELLRQASSEKPTSIREALISMCSLYHHNDLKSNKKT
jgi:hypothetical protein